jgi:hypothetical protein
MTLQAKLQLQPGSAIRVLGAPPEFDLEFPAVGASDSAVLLFVRNRDELETEKAPFVAAARADVLAWLAYPKGGRLGTDLNRDILRAATEADGIRPVRQISIDDTWSALRFRPS